MMEQRVEFAVGRRRFLTLNEAVAAAEDQTLVYRLHLSRRGVRNIERRTPGGNWRRVQTLPDPTVRVVGYGPSAEGRGHDAKPKRGGMPRRPSANP